MKRVSGSLTLLLTAVLLSGCAPWWGPHPAPSGGPAPHSSPAPDHHHHDEPRP
ncbi:MAG: hypothetical protein KYX62_12345 [Pseudomonadota bacterium]|nr:hypothetical protein [Pseudomonadota bacterium]